MAEGQTSDRAQAVARALVEVGAGAGDVPSVTRPLLEALRTLTGLEATYLTAIDWDRGMQRVLFADGDGTLDVDEGLEVAWPDALCRRALESGVFETPDVPGTWGDSEVAAELGIQTFVTAPVVLPDGELYGTLCGASAASVRIGEPTRALLSVFSRIVADSVARERQLGDADQRAGESERLLRARTQFIAATQHRLKTPLTVIQGWAALLLDGGDEMEATERRSALEAISRAAANAAADVSSLLDESESDALARDVSIGPVDVLALARAVCDDLTALSRRHRIVVEDDGDAPPAHTDRRALRVVLEHLVENAVKYSPGGGTVDVSVGLSDAGRVRLSVRDGGIGLPTGIDIFAPFSRGTEVAAPGSGLGLHVVQSLVHAVGGEVTAARNTDGPGSTLTVLLPAASTRSL